MVKLFYLQVSCVAALCCDCAIAEYFCRRPVQWFESREEPLSSPIFPKWGSLTRIIYVYIYMGNTLGRASKSLCIVKRINSATVREPRWDPDCTVDSSRGLAHMYMFPWCRRLLVVLTVFCLLLGNNAVLAQTASNSGASGNKAVNLDLSSSQRNLSVGNLVKSGPVTVQVGQTTQSITGSDLVTAAERLAVFQVVSSGHQSITLDGTGAAVGGSFNIGPRFSQYVSSLVIPSGVTAVKNFANNSTLNLSGNLTNNGAFYAVSTNPAVTNATISAANIINQSRGLISSVLPAAGLPGFASAITALSLTLNATNNFYNAGIIRSSGSLTATAGGSITNAAGAVMQAVNNVNLISQIGNFVNAGLIAAQSGNVNFTVGQTVANMVVNGTGGTVQALSGSINFAGLASNGLSSLNLSGGDYLSKELNIDTGCGSAVVSVGNVSGKVNVTAGSIDLQVSAPELSLGALNVTGDPIVINNGGSIDISTMTPIVGDEFVAIAAGNITSSNNSFIIKTYSTTGSGGNIILAAGAVATQDAETTTITGRSGSGGDILLHNVSGASTIFDTGSGANGGSGGNVTLIAFTDGATGSYNGGHIYLPDAVSGVAEIKTGSTSAVNPGPNGSVTIIAEATSSTSSPVIPNGYTISVGNINTYGNGSGLNGITGGIFIATATPSISATTPVAILGGSSTQNSPANGSILAGTFWGGTVQSGVTQPWVLQDGAVYTGSLHSNGGPLGGVLIYAGSNANSSYYAVSTGGITTSGVSYIIAGAHIPSSYVSQSFNVSIRASSGVSIVGNGSNNPNINITTPGSISIAGSIAAMQMGLVAGSSYKPDGGIQISGPITISGTGGSGGTLYLIGLGDNSTLSKYSNIVVNNTLSSLPAITDQPTATTGATIYMSTPGTITVETTYAGYSGDIIELNPTSSNTAGGNIFFSSGSSSSQAIQILGATHNINTSGTGSGTAGSVWMFSLPGSERIGSYTVNSTSVTSNSTGGKDWTAGLSRFSFPTGLTTIQFPAGAAPINYSPGGYTGLSDSSAAINIEVANNAGSIFNLPICVTGANGISLTNSSSTLTVDAVGGIAPRFSLFSQIVDMGNAVIQSSDLSTSNSTVRIPSLVSNSGLLSITSASPLVICCGAPQVAAGTFTVTSSQGISGPIMAAAGAVSISTTANNGSITITRIAAPAVTLTANGNGSILDLDNNPGSLKTAVLTLVSGSGNIGAGDITSSSNFPVATTAAFLKVNTSGNVWLEDFNSGSLWGSSTVGSLQWWELGTMAYVAPGATVTASGLAPSGDPGIITVYSPNLFVLYGALSTSIASQNIEILGLNASVPSVYTWTTNSLLLGGTGTITTSSSGSTVINPSSSALSTLQFFGSNDSQPTHYTISGGGALMVFASTVQFNNNTGSTISATGPVTIQPPGAVPALTINVGISSYGGGSSTTASATISSSGSGYIVQPNGSGSFLFGLGSGATAGTLSFNGAPLTMTTSNPGGITISSNTSLISDNDININVNGGTLSNAGTISSTAGGAGVIAITIEGTGNVTLINTGTISAATAHAAINIQSLSGNLNIGGSGTIASNSTGVVAMAVLGSSGTLTVNDATAQTITGAGKVYLLAPNITFAATTASPSLIATGATVGMAGSYTSTDASLVITAPAGFAGTITGGSFSILPSPSSTSGGAGTLTFANSGASAATLNLYGGAVSVQYFANLNVHANVTLASDSNINMSINNGTLTINGTVSTSSNTITLQSTGLLSVAGSGQVVKTGLGSATITLQSLGTSAFNISQSFFNVLPGTSGTVIFSAPTAGASLVTNNSSSITLSQGSLELSSPLIALGNGSSISASSIAVDSGGVANDLTIQTPTGGSATLQATVGAISITAPSGHSLIFAQSGGSGSSTLHLNGSPVTTTSTTGNTTVNVGVTVATNSSITVNVNSGIFTNNGTLQSTESAVAEASINVVSSSAVTIAGTGSLNPGANNLAVISGGSGVTLAAGLNMSVVSGSLSISTPVLAGAGGAGGSTSTFVNVGASSSSFILNNPGASFVIGNAAGTGTATLNFNGAPIVTESASWSIAAPTNVTIDAGTTLQSNKNITFDSPSFQLGSGSAVSGSTGSVITFTSGGGNQDLIIMGPDNSSATISGSGSGSINFTPSGSGAITFASSGIHSTTLNLSGVLVVMTSTSVDGLTISSGVSLNSDGPMTVNVSLLSNQGSLHITGTGNDITIQNTGALSVVNAGNIQGNNNILMLADGSTPPLSVSGVGSLSAALALDFEGGIVNVAQQSITGNVYGYAHITGPLLGQIDFRNFLLTVANGDLNLIGPSPAGVSFGTGILTNFGDISITNSSGNIYVNGVDSVLLGGHAPAIIAGFAGWSFYSQTNVIGPLAISSNVALVAHGTGANGNIYVGLQPSPLYVFAYGPTIASTGGNVSLNADNTVQTAGGAGSPGFSAPAKLTAMGGNILVQAGNEVNIEGTAFKAIAQAVQPYASGGIGIFAGSGMDLSAQIVGMLSRRVSPNTIEWQSGHPGCVSCTINVNNGGYLTVTSNVVGPTPDGSLYGVDFNLNGGVVYLDPPPSPSPTPAGVIINSDTSFMAVAPGFSGPEPTPQPKPIPPTPTPIIIIPIVEPIHIPSTGGLIAIATDKTPPLTPAVPSPPALSFQDVRPVAGLFFVSSTPCSLYGNGQVPGAQIQGEAGTIFAVKPDSTFVLASGRMLAGAGQNGLDVQVGSSDQIVRMKGQTIAIIDAAAKSGVRVTVLAGDGPDAAAIRAGNQPLMSLAVGEEAVFVDQADSEELIPVDGVERQPIGASVTKFGLRMRKASVPVGQLVNKEPLLRCCFSVGGSSAQTICHDSWVARRLHQLYGEPEEPAITQEIGPSSGARRISQVQPTGYTTAGWAHGTGVATGATEALPYSRRIMGSSKSVIATVLDDSEIYTLANDVQPVSYLGAGVPTDVRFSENAELVTVGAGHYRLVKGSVLTTADKELTIDTKDGTVVSRGGAVALISSEGGITRVYDLNDRQKGDVRVLADRHSYDLLPGCEVGVVRGATKAEAVQRVRAAQMGRRKMQIVQVNENTQLVTNDFSLVDVLHGSSLLANLNKSAVASDRRLFADILKMAAVLSMTTDRTRGSYSREGRQ